MDEHLRVTGRGCRDGSKQMLLHLPSGALSLVEEESCIGHHPSVINFTEAFPGATGAQNKESRHGGGEAEWWMNDDDEWMMNEWMMNEWMIHSYTVECIHPQSCFSDLSKELCLVASGLVSALNRLCLVKSWSRDDPLDKMVLETRSTVPVLSLGICEPFAKWFSNEFIVREGRTGLMSPWGTFRVGREG